MSLVSRLMARGRLFELGAIATAAGAFSGLLGVGGGTVIVPLLILWLGFGEREAAGTSLVAIAVIGALGATAQGLYGNVDLLRGMIVGLPGVAGVLAGATLAQRVPERAISLLFAGLLAIVSIHVLVG